MLSAAAPRAIWSVAALAAVDGAAGGGGGLVEAEGPVILPARDLDRFLLVATGVRHAQAIEMHVQGIAFRHPLDQHGAAVAFDVALEHEPGRFEHAEPPRYGRPRLLFVLRLELLVIVFADRLKV